MLQPGTVIGGRFQVIRLLGQGGMSNIYVCQDTHLGGILAVKEFTARYANAQEQQTALKYFRQEADLLHHLSHPNLPVIHDYFQHQGLHYIVMDFVQGEDLGKILERNPGPYSEKSVAEWAVQVATVLYYLHCQKPPIIFRDIKPSNIIINNGQVKLIDFGIARHFRPEKKGDTMRIGSPGYAPPEQYNGQSDKRSDIYALGATMHQALTGIDPTTSKKPFVFKPVREVNPQVSETMANIVAKALKVVPEERYQSMVEMKRDLRGLLQPQLAMTRPASAQPALANASQDLLKSAPPAPATAPVPVNGPAANTNTASGSPAKNAGSPAAKAPAGNSPVPKKRWGCFKASVITALVLVIAIVFGPTIINFAISVRAKHLGLNPALSRQRIFDRQLYWNVLNYPQPLPCDSPGGQLFINGAPPADCLKKLDSEPFSPKQLVYKQDAILLQQARQRMTVQAAGLDAQVVQRRLLTPLNLDSVDIALLVPATVGQATDWGGQCLVGAAVAQQYLSNWASQESKVNVLLPLAYTDGTLQATLDNLSSTDIRRTISCEDYRITSYRPNFALVFYQCKSDNDQALNAIVSASNNCPIPIFAVGLSDSFFRMTSIQQGTAGTSWSYALPTLGKGELRADLPQSLPLATKQNSQAQVTVSPFHSNAIGAQAYEVYRRLLNEKGGYSLWPQAFDALCLALCNGQTFQGLQANFSSNGTAKPLPASIYKLQGKYWIHADANSPKAEHQTASPAPSAPQQTASEAASNASPASDQTSPKATPSASPASDQTSPKATPSASPTSDQTSPKATPSASPASNQTSPKATPSASQQPDAIPTASATAKETE